jgi:hypothetical protein
MPCEQMQQTERFRMEMWSAESRVKTYLQDNIQNYSLENRLPVRDISTDIREPLERTMHAIDHLITRGEIGQGVAILISGKHPRAFQDNDFIQIRDLQEIEKIAIPVGIVPYRSPPTFATPTLTRKQPDMMIGPRNAWINTPTYNIGEKIDARITYDSLVLTPNQKIAETIREGFVADQGPGEYSIEYGPFGIRTRFVPRR